MKVLIVRSPGNAEFVSVPIPEPKRGEIRARVVRNGLCGTDLAIYTGECSFVRDGQIVYPTRIGHEWSGVVDKVGEGVLGFREGDRVIADNAVSCGACGACREGRYENCMDIRSVGTVNCWPGSFAEYMLIPERHMYHIPDSISFDNAALLEPLSIAYGAFRGKAPDTVVVIGTGPIGLSAVALARTYGAREIIMVGRRDAKLCVAENLGATKLVNTQMENAITAVRAHTSGRGADLVVEASGAETMLAQTIEMTRKFGRVAAVAFYEKLIGGVPIDRLVLEEITLQGVAGCFGNLRSVLVLMEERNLDLTPMITHRVAFENCLDFFRNDAQYRDAKIKVMVEYMEE